MCVALLILKDPCTKVHRTEVDYTFCVMTMANTHRLCVANSVCVKVVPTFKPHVLTISVQTFIGRVHSILHHIPCLRRDCTFSRISCLLCRSEQAVLPRVPGLIFELRLWASGLLVESGVDIPVWHVYTVVFTFSQQPSCALCVCVCHKEVFVCAHVVRMYL